jgi:hypothetical protein
MPCAYSGKDLKTPPGNDASSRIASSRSSYASAWFAAAQAATENGLCVATAKNEVMPLLASPHLSAVFLNVGY